MKKSKQARAHEFSPAQREKIRERDGGRCIFCEMAYCMDGATEFEQGILSYMHYIPRSRGGLGIEENGALGCVYHHDMLDNGKDGRRPEMLNLFATYLRRHYKEWDKTRLVYNKYAL